MLKIMRAQYFAVMLTFLSLMLCAVCSLSGCGGNDTVDETTLIMGTSADMPPFEFYQDQDIVGYDIDVARAVAAQLGKTLEIRDMDFSTLIPALQSGRVHMVMASMTPTPERRQAIGFSEAYLTLPVAVLSMNGHDFSTPQGFQNKMIGVQLGSTHEQYAHQLAKADPTITVKSLNKLSELVEELKTRRVDGIVMETTTALSFQEVHKMLTVQQITGVDITFSIAMKKGSSLRTDVDQALQVLKDNGTLQAIRQKWFKTLAAAQ